MKKINKNYGKNKEGIKKDKCEARNNLTELVFILDRSGSMAGLESDTIGGFNAMIEKQKKEEGEVFVTTVLFDNQSEVVHDRVSLKEIPKMTDKDYTVGGCTALVDAMGQMMEHIANIHKYARKEDVPAHTMFIITTDGQENASHKYSSDEVKKMIEQRKERDGWEFLFIGANIDAVQTAANFGIERNRAVNYRADRRGTQVLYETLTMPISAMRASQVISDDWCQKIDEDYKKRKDTNESVN